MRIKELELIQPSKEVVEFFKNFMQEHNKGLKAIKTLAEIKEIAEINKLSQIGYNPDWDTILQKINEVEDANSNK